MLTGERFFRQGWDGFSLLVFLEAYIAPWVIAGLLVEWLELYEQHQTSLEKELGMAKKTERPNVTFINVRLEKADKDAVAEWARRKGFNYLNELEHLLQSGHKVGVTWDNRNNCFIASITCWEEGGENFGHCFSSRHASTRKALELALYKVLVTLDGKTWADHSEANDFG